jgi:hypothetical protein
MKKIKNNMAAILAFKKFFSKIFPESSSNILSNLGESRIIERIKMKIQRITPVLQVNSEVIIKAIIFPEEK